MLQITPPFILQSLAPRARQTELRGGLPLLPRSCARQEPLSAALKLFKWQGDRMAKSACQQGQFGRVV